MIRPSARRSRSGDDTPAVPQAGPATVTVEEAGSAFVLRTADTAVDEQLSLISDIVPDDDATLIVVAVPDEMADALWPHLSELLTRLKGQRRTFVLAMSGAGVDRTDRPALAQRIADAWETVVVAPSGDVVLAPGGTLFARPGDRSDGDLEPQWLSFARGTRPKPLGSRWPAPAWQSALGDLGIPDGPCELTHVPAGVLVRPAGSPEPGPGDLPYAIPAHPERPSVLVGLPDTPRVAAADLVAALSGAASGTELRRHPLRLVPSGGGDLLPLGQTVARELRLDVEVLTGLPVDLAYDPGEETDGQWVVLVDADGHPTWSPFVASVLCRPPARDGGVPAPRLQSWHPPAEGMEVIDAARGVLRLDDTWRLSVTRAGVWMYEAADDDLPEQLMIRRPVTEDTVRLDAGTPGRPLSGDPWTVLDGLLRALSPGLRARLLLAVHGELSVEGDESARKLADRHGVRLETDATPETVPAPEREPAPRVTPPPSGSRVLTTHRSTEEERAAFRAMIGLQWDSHAAPLRRAFSRLPAIAAGERAAATVDLVAVRLYLTAQRTEPDGEFGPAALHSGDERLRPYLACLASGLRRLPTYRGAVLRGVDASAQERARLRPDTTILAEPGPVGGLSFPGETSYGWPQTSGAYVIWSDTARRVAALFDTDTAVSTPRNEVVFGPGSRFLVLDVRRGDADTPDLTLLRELPATAGEDEAPAGRLALTRLRETLETEHLASSGTPWPAHCVGPIGGPRSTPSAGGQAVGM